MKGSKGWWIRFAVGALMLAVTACGMNPLAPAAGPVVPAPAGTATVEIIALQHPPVIPILQEIDAVPKP